MDDRQMLVDHVKGYINSHPNMNMNLAREMAKFVQNLYDMQVQQGKTIELQKKMMESQRKSIESQQALIALLKQDKIIKSII
jgi:hypothetical protein